MGTYCNCYKDKNTHILNISFVLIMQVNRKLFISYVYSYYVGILVLKICTIMNKQSIFKYLCVLNKYYFINV